MQKPYWKEDRRIGESRKVQSFFFTVYCLLFTIIVFTYSLPRPNPPERPSMIQSRSVGLPAFERSEGQAGRATVQCVSSVGRAFTLY